MWTSPSPLVYNLRMDEEKLKWLSELEGQYPLPKSVTSLDDIPHVFYLHEKGLAEIHSSKGTEPLKRMDQRAIDAGVTVRITADGLDAIKLIAEKMKENIPNIEIPKKTGNILKTLLEAGYKEGKEFASTTIAKYLAEITPKPPI